jgi:hypothetical protein
MSKTSSNRPQDNAFQQQKLKAWQPLLTPNWVIGTFSIVGLLFVIIGPIILDASNGIFEREEQYDNSPDCEDQEFCEVTFTIDIGDNEVVEGPLFLYYKLSNFYQNHRRYVKSRSDEQLADSNNPDLSTCDPLQKWPQNDGLDLYPCGLIANSYFNDTFANVTHTNQDGTIAVTLNEEDIAWASDHDKFVARAATDDETRIGPGGFVLPPVDDPHFMVWMRTAGLPTFKKLYAKIEDIELRNGDVLTINVTNVFPVSSFDGKKFLVISTTSWLGGKNTFLGYAYLVVGVICLLLALGFLLRQKMCPRKLGDMQYFNWLNAGGSEDAEKN